MYSCCDRPGAAPSRSTTPSSSEAEVITGGIGQLLDQGQPAADPALVPAEQIGDLDLSEAVVADQGMDDPGVFPLLGAAAGLVEAVDGRLGGAVVGRPDPRGDGRPAEGPGGGQPLEAVEDLVGVVARADDQRGELAVAA